LLVSNNDTLHTATTTLLCTFLFLTEQDIHFSSFPLSVPSL